MDRGGKGIDPRCERVVVTGIGLVTPIGSGHKAVWRGLLEGRLGFAPVESFDTSAYSVNVGAEVKDFRPELYVRRFACRSRGHGEGGGCEGAGSARLLGRASCLAIAAGRLALDDAGLDLEALDPTSVGVALGTTSGEPIEVERYNDRLLEDDLDGAAAAFVDRYPCHLIATHLAAELGISGPNIMVPAACAAGNYALGWALDTLRAGSADVMFAGGADAFSRITYTGFARLGAIAPEVCQPFDRERKGMIPGEGAAILILERMESALERGARVHAELAGYGLSCDAHHMTAARPDGEGAARAMLSALASAGMTPEDVSYISAHGTGTPTNDRLETISVKRVFGERAGQVPTSSVKSMLGHTMGAASAIEAAVCSLAVSEDVVPPTMNHQVSDPECDLDYVTEGAREVAVEVAMNNAYAFGGNNASVLFRKCRAAA